MGVDIDQLRRDHETVIDLNPVMIEFDRPVYVLDPAMRVSRKTGATQHVGPMKVRVVQDRYVVESTRVAPAGRIDTGRRWGLLALWDADLKGDPPEPDVFDAPGYGRFRVRDVIPRMLEGQTWGYDADIERVA